MKHSNEEILNALHVIANTCELYSHCSDCPLYDEDHEECCFNQYDPSALPIRDEKPTIWRAIY